MIAAPVACGERGDELAADDQRLLVGEREVDPLAQRRDRRKQSRRADDPVQHQVALALGDQPDDAVGPGQHLTAGPRLARPRGRVGVGHRDLADAVAAGLLEQRLPRARGAQRDDRELGRARDHVEGLAADRPGRAEDRDASGHSIQSRRSARRARARARPALSAELRDREPDVVADDDREQRAVEAIERAAVRSEHAARVLGPGIALDQRLEQVAERPEHRDRHPEQERVALGQPGLVQAGQEHRQDRDQHPADQALDGLVRRDLAARAAGARTAARRCTRRCPPGTSRPGRRGTRRCRASSWRSSSACANANPTQ